MFKVGDRVVLTEDYGRKCVGSTGVVTKCYSASHKEGSRTARQLVDVKLDKNTYISCFDFRLALVSTTSSDEAFNVSTATDQELADEYRRLYVECQKIGDTLRERGFTLHTTCAGRPVQMCRVDVKDISFSKTVAETIKL